MISPSVSGPVIGTSRHGEESALAGSVSVPASEGGRVPLQLAGSGGPIIVPCVESGGAGSEGASKLNSFCRGFTRAAWDEGRLSLRRGKPGLPLRNRLTNDPPSLGPPAP